MLYFLLFIAELSVLFLLSRTLTNLLFRFFYKTTKSKKLSIYLLSVLFLPGTIIHELAHAFMAILLQVHVGKMEFWPKLQENNLKLGSVEIAKTDPIRRILIGISPFLTGVSLILVVFFLAVKNDIFNQPLYIALLTYIVFEIGNTMFSSKKDLEGAFEVVVAVSVIISVFYVIGFRLPAFNPSIIFSNQLVVESLQKANIYLLAPLILNIWIILTLKFFKF